MIALAAFYLRSSIIFSPANHLHKIARLFSPSRPPGGDADGGSAVYRNARKYAPPLIVSWMKHLHNSASFIGTVEYPIKQIATRNDSFGVFTILRVKTSPDSNTSFRILVQIWGELGQKALQHLKPNDYIYVSGQLGAYTKAAPNGIKRIKYKVIARELNFVNQGEREEIPQRNVKTEPEVWESPAEKYRSRLHKWQVFFVNPSEWYDNRKSKKTPKHPDFVHKSTGEVLWLSIEDPPWVRKQLDLLDSKLSRAVRNDRNDLISDFLSSNCVSHK